MNAMKDALAKKLMELKAKGHGPVDDEHNNKDDAGLAPDLESEGSPEEEASESPAQEAAEQSLMKHGGADAAKEGSDHHMSILAALGDHNGSSGGLHQMAAAKAKEKMASIMKHKKG